METRLFKDLKKNNLITGRGATAIYLVFCNENLSDIDVLVPANVCYAAVFPVIASGNQVVFCDVDRNSGNVTLDILKNYKTDKTRAVIAPHMYGNSVNDLSKIKEWCSINDMILIEDCASSLGGKNEKYGDLGTLGDYIIYSFGHSKIVDMGKGGILSSDRNLSKAEETLTHLPVFNDDIGKMEDELSLRYRDARYISGNYEQVKELLKNELFLYQTDSYDELKEMITDRGLFSHCIEEHIRNYDLYDKNVNGHLKRYRYNNGSVPWRFSLMLNAKTKKAVINALLKDRLPVSDWYPNVTNLFNDVKLPFENVDIMEKELLNFQLDIDEETILRICNKINSVTGDC